MPEIKERPILFSAPMVRAILEGRKTVTRRLVKVQPFDLSWSSRDHRIEYVSGRAENGDEVDGFHAYTTRAGGEWSAKCPFGQPGDRMWVRETFNRTNPGGAEGVYYYRADGVFPKIIGGGKFTDAESWKPCIHMPRIASRILLEITDVRVERLQDGDGETDFDSRYLAEGINRIHHGDGEYHYHAFKTEAGPGNWNDPFDAWRELWVSVSGADSWNANPWVWVVEFQQVTP